VSRHISEQYDTELETVRRRFMEMGGLVEQQMVDAVRALVTHDSDLGERIRARDHEVNRFEVSLDEQCIHIIARRQPAAGDLRLLVTIMKASTDLERMGDEADKIARMAIGASKLEIPEDQYREVRHLAELVGRMVSAALDAVARLDTEEALTQIAADKVVDRAYQDVLQRLVAKMTHEPESVERSLSTIWAARALERIGDHAKNISEYVLYLVKGKDIRHLPKDSLAAEIGKPASGTA
jgi:phosphate transport system protein